MVLQTGGIGYYTSILSHLSYNILLPHTTSLKDADYTRVRDQSRLIFIPFLNSSDSERSCPFYNRHGLTLPLPQLEELQDNLPEVKAGAREAIATWQSAWGMSDSARRVNSEVKTLKSSLQVNIWWWTV